jgi:DHA2 family multidrug resistance protein
VGQSFGLSAIVFFAVLHLRPQDAITFGAGTQVARLMGGEIGTAFIVTFIRIRGQIASNHLGLHVQIGDGQVAHRIETYAAITAPAGNSGPARGAAVLGNVVHSMAVTQGIIDAFVVIAAATAVTLILIVTRRGAPLGPASPVSPFARRAS